jgi:opacity protein-like surface antigen
MKRILFLFIASLYVASATATDFWDNQRPDKRMTLGLRAGVNASKQYATDCHADQSFRLGYQAGVALDLNLIRSMSLNTGLMFYQKGWKDKYDEVRGHIKWTDNAIYIEIPVLASYRVPLNDNVGFQLNFGPYLACGIGGKTKVSSDFATTYNYKLDSFDEDRGRNRFDVGLSAGAAFTISHFYVGACYERGLLNTSQLADYSYRNGTVALNIGYNF